VARIAKQPSPCATPSKWSAGRCQPLQVLIEIHPSMEDFDDFERVRLLAQDQEM
jgi:hypothetical protein